MLEKCFGMLVLLPQYGSTWTTKPEEADRLHILNPNLREKSFCTNFIEVNFETCFALLALSIITYYCCFLFT